MLMNDANAGSDRVLGRPSCDVAAIYFDLAGVGLSSTRRAFS
jgi:hypothetical protein